MVQCKAEPRPSLFSTVVERRFGKDGHDASTDIPVLAAPFISERMGQVAWDKNWSWFDLAGDYRIKIGDAIYITKTGRPRQEPAPRPMVNLSRFETARILRVILAPENEGKEWTQHSLQLEIRAGANWMPGASMGLINKVVRSLRDDNYVEQLDHRPGFRLREPLGLLAAWRKAYDFTRHRRQGYFTLFEGLKLQEGLARFGAKAEGPAAFAAFSAAEWQAPAVRQPKTWLYLAAEVEELFRTEVQAKPVVSGENLVVLFPADHHVFYGWEGQQGPELRCTNPIQTCLDLSSIGSRGEEAAQAILNQRLKPAWGRRVTGSHLA